MLHPFLNEKLPEITRMFKEHHVKSAYAFGSVVTDKFNEKSDVDFIINIKYAKIIFIKTFTHPCKSKFEPSSNLNWTWFSLCPVQGWSSLNSAVEEEGGEIHV